MDDTKRGHGHKFGGGLGKMFRRALSGESLFIVDYYTQGGDGEVAFANEFRGKIVVLNMQEGQHMIVQKDAFMCAEKSVDVDLHFRKKLGAGLFGGEGFILQKLSGPGQAFVNFDGEIVEMNLAPGELLRVDTGHVAMFEPTVDFDIELQRGFKNILLGGEGLFLASLRGPRRVYLQSIRGGKRNSQSTSIPRVTTMGEDAHYGDSGQRFTMTALVCVDIHLQSSIF